MGEHLSGYQPENAPEEGLTDRSNDLIDLAAAHQTPAPDEIERMRQSAAEVAADMEAGHRPYFPATPPFDAVTPFAFVSDEEGAAHPVWGLEPLDEQMYPEEAPIQSQREHARHYYRTLTALTEWRYRREETLPETQELIEAYASYIELITCENQAVPPQEFLFPAIF